MIWKKWWRLIHRHNYLFVKLGFSILLLGFIFKTVFSGTNVSSEAEETRFMEKTMSPQEQVSEDLIEDTDQFPQKDPNAEKCDLFTGDWVPNPAGPVYTNESCHLIETHQNCMTNGRPDLAYLYWKWRPRDCEIPRFDSKKFLRMMRDKKWAFIGDSISRNHVQSLLCMLHKVEPVVEVYHDEEYQSRRWQISSYNFTISVIWSPFLAEAAIFENKDGVATSEILLHLDKLDNTWTNQFKDFDYMIFSTGEWYSKSSIYYENEIVLGCHYCPKQNLTELGFDFAYKKVLNKVFDFIVSSDHKGMIFYRTTAPDHFENGEWFSGGNCKRTNPVKKGQFELNLLTKTLREVELDEFEKAINSSRGDVNLKLLDLMELSLLRPDGHPGPYRHYRPFEKDKNAKVINDCLHWCLPGPIDSWNDVIMEMVLSG